MISIQLSVVVLLLGFVGGGAGYTLGGSRSKGSRIELHNLPLFQHRPSGHPTQTAVVKNGQGKMENEEGNAYAKVRRSESAYDYGTVLACLPPSFLPSVHVSFHFLLFLFLSICARPFLNICRFTFWHCASLFYRHDCVNTEFLTTYLAPHLTHSGVAGVMFDAGSSGTRCYVYKWPKRK